MSLVSQLVCLGLVFNFLSVFTMRAAFQNPSKRCSIAAVKCSRVAVGFGPQPITGRYAASSAVVHEQTINV